MSYNLKINDENLLRNLEFETTLNFIMETNKNYVCVRKICHTNVQNFYNLGF